MDLTAKSKSLQVAVEEAKTKTVAGTTVGSVGSVGPVASNVAADATQKIITAVLGHDDTPYMCFERLQEYAKRNMDLSGGDSWSTLPDGRVISSGGRPLNSADQTIVRYCGKILDRWIAVQGK